MVVWKLHISISNSVKSLVVWMSRFVCLFLLPFCFELVQYFYHCRNTYCFINGIMYQVAIFQVQYYCCLVGIIGSAVLESLGFIKCPLNFLQCVCSLLYYSFSNVTV